MTISDRLREAGIDVEFWWERTSTSRPTLAQSPNEVLERIVQRVHAKRKALGDQEFRRIGFWLEDLPNDPAWHALLEELLRRDRGAFLDFRETIGSDNAWFVVVDRVQHPDLFERLRELRWQKAAAKAARDGRRLPHLLEGDRFSLRGYNLQVTGIGGSNLSVILLDEEGSMAAGAVLFDDVEFGPPVENSRPLPRSARQRKYLIASLCEYGESPGRQD